MPGRWNVLILFLLILGVVPAVGAVSWTIEEARMFPMNASNGSSMTVVANISDDQGKPVNPARCDAPGDQINIRYEYPFGADRKPMYYAGTEGWFYNDSLSALREKNTVTVYAGGTCNGVTAPSITENVSFRPSGNLSVSFLTDLSGDYSAGDVLTVSWNVTNESDMGSGVDRGFEDKADPSFQLYTLTGKINVSGTVSGGEVLLQGDRYTADITLPVTGGRYVLNINASNPSLSFDHPYGGAAKAVNVVSDLKGDVSLEPVDQTCQAGTWLACEKGGTFEVRFREQVQDAEMVNVSIEGEGNTYTFFMLSRFNASLWNGTVRLSEDLNTSRYGHSLAVVVNASNDLDMLRETTGLNLSRFKLLESTQQFVDQGKTIDLVAGPVTPFTELPVGRGNISTINFSVMNTSDMLVFNTSLSAPFSDAEYEDDQKMFRAPYTLPADADTGEYTVTAAQTDVHGVTAWLSYPFTVLSGSGVERPVTLEAVDGEETNEFDAVYDVPGNVSFSVTLNNTENAGADVTPVFTGDLAGRGELFGGPVQFSGEGVETAYLNLSLPSGGIFSGTMNLSVHGSGFTDYNISVPVNLSVGGSCTVFNESLCLRSLDLSRTVAVPGTYNVSFVVASSVATDAAVNVTGNASVLLPDDTVPVDASPARFLAPFSVSAGDEGFYTGDIVVDTGTVSARTPVEIRVQQEGGGGSLTVEPVLRNLGTFTEGEAVPVEIRVSNTGGSTITELDVRASSLGVFELATVNLGPGESTTLSYEGTAPDLEGQGTITIQVEAGSGVVNTTTVSLTAYGNFTERFDQFEADISGFRGRLDGKGGDVAAVREDISRMEQLVEEGRDAADRGDYAMAQSRFSEAETLREDVSAAIQDLPEEEVSAPSEGGGLPVIPIVVVLVILLVVGVILYLSLVPEEGGEPDFSRPPPRKPGTLGS